MCVIYVFLLQVRNRAQLQAQEQELLRQQQAAQAAAVAAQQAALAADHQSRLEAANNIDGGPDPMDMQ